MAKDNDSASATAQSSDSVTKVEALDHKKADLGLKSTEKESIEEKGVALDMIAASDDEDLESDISGLQPIVCVGINHENFDDNFRVLKNEKGNEFAEKIIELESRINSIEVARKTESADKYNEIILSMKKKMMELETAIHSVEFELSKSKKAVNISDAKVGEFEKELNILHKKMEQVLSLGGVNGGVVHKDGSSNKQEMNLKLAFGVGAIAVVVGGIVSVYCARRR